MLEPNEESLKLTKGYQKIQDIEDKIKGYQRPFYKLENYINPTQSVNEINHTLRDIKKKTVAQRHEIRKDIDHRNPKSSMEKLDSLVFQSMFNTIRDELKKTNKIPHDNVKDNILKEIGEFDERYVEGIIDKIQMNISKEALKQNKTMGLNDHKFQSEEIKRKLDENKTYDQRKVELALREIEEKERSKFMDSSLLARVIGDPLLTKNLPKDYFLDNPEIARKIDDEINNRKSEGMHRINHNKQNPKNHSLGSLRTEPVFSASKWMKTEFHHPGVYVNFV